MTKEMYKRFESILLLLSGLLILNGCRLSGETNHTPEIRISNGLIHDTTVVNVYYSVNAGYYQTDSVYVGDSISFSFLFYSYENHLLTCDIKTDTALAYMRFASAEHLDSVFLKNKSNYEQGHFVLPDRSYSLAQIYGVYIPRKASGESFIDLGVTSDSKFSIRTMRVKIPAVDTTSVSSSE